MSVFEKKEAKKVAQFLMGAGASNAIGKAMQVAAENDLDVMISFVPRKKVEK